MSQTSTPGFILWDSSALGKRYISECGTDTVEAIFQNGWSIVTVDMVYAETANIILRQRNVGAISKTRFLDARRELERDISDDPDVALLSFSSKAILSSIDLANKHNLNSVDATLLYLFLDYAKAQTLPCVLLVADARFVRAATAEGLMCLNTEALAPDDLPGFFQGL